LTVGTATMKMGGSMPPKVEIDTATYSGRVSARIRKFREERGWTVAELASRINHRTALSLAKSTIHGWDNGSRKVDPDYYPEIAAAFGLTVRKFLPAR
jgi:transcriptional regulator with XRE-family HTH domain